ncbi:hypothetical protein GE09DRAFT_1015037, partial [Coniochaeta sp. 2T2.1]
MSNKTLPDERVVYLALKNVFKGPNAEVRQLKKIQKLILMNQQQGDVASLIRAHNIDTVCNTVRTLLIEQIFASTLKAKIRFPEVFDVSPTQSAEREASEVEAARNEANAIEDAIQGNTRNVQNKAVTMDCADPQPSIDRGSKTYPSLFPVYLPLRTQHYLLAKVQTLLEQACFDFGQRHMESVLQRHQWDCPEAAELNLWAAEFVNSQKLFEKRKDVGQPLEKLLRSVAHIRHTAVHRIRVSARGVERFMLDAESLATLLDEPQRLRSLKELRRETQSTIEELERNKHVLGSKLDENLKRIAAERAELDRLEKVAVREMCEEDHQYQVYAGTNLERAI